VGYVYVFLWDIYWLVILGINMTNKDDLVSKDTALKMAIEALEKTKFPVGDKRNDAITACKEALERPNNMVAVPLDKLQDMQRRLKALEQPTEPRLVSYALDGSTCTLNIDGEEIYFNCEQLSQTTSLEDVIKEFEKDPEMKNLMQQERAKLLAHFETLEQPAWQGLTDDEIGEAQPPIDVKISMDEFMDTFARAIEQTLKEKNHG
jgi:hypothetical protein